MTGYLHESVVELDSSNENFSQGPGERLRKRRESLGFTHADVAGHLNLRISVIEGLETNNYKHIPKLVFARGYLRSYAKILNLPGNEIIEAFDKLEYPENPSNLPASPIREGQKKASKKEHSFLPWIMLFVLIVLVAVVGFWNSITHFVTDTQSPSAVPVEVTPSMEKSTLADLSQNNADVTAQESDSALPDLNQEQDQSGQ